MLFSPSKAPGICHYKKIIQKPIDQRLYVWFSNCGLELDFRAQLKNCSLYAQQFSIVAWYRSLSEDP